MAAVFPPKSEVKYEGADGHVRKALDTQVIEVREGTTLIARVQYWTRSDQQIIEIEVIRPGSDGIVKPEVVSVATLRRGAKMSLATMNLNPVPRDLWSQVVGFINAYMEEMVAPRLRAVT